MQKIEWVSIFLVNLLTLKLQQQQTFPFAQTPVKIVLKKYLNEGLEAQILKKAYRNPPTPPPPHLIYGHVGIPASCSDR
jgi:hypothetical protein